MIQSRYWSFGPLKGNCILMGALIIEKQVYVLMVVCKPGEIFALSVIHDLDTKSIDFVLVAPQIPLDINVFMEL